MPAPVVALVEEQLPTGGEELAGGRLQPPYVAVADTAGIFTRWSSGAVLRRHANRNASVRRYEKPARHARVGAVVEHMDKRRQPTRNRPELGRDQDHEVTRCRSYSPMETSPQVLVATSHDADVAVHVERRVFVANREKHFGLEARRKRFLQLTEESARRRLPISRGDNERHTRSSVAPTLRPPHDVDRWQPSTAAEGDHRRTGDPSSLGKPLRCLGV